MFDHGFDQFYRARTKDGSGVPGIVAPKMLNRAVFKQGDQLQVEAEAAFDEAEDLFYFGAKAGIHGPFCSSLACRPPMLELSVDGYAKFVVARGGFIGLAELAADHHWRAMDIRAEFFFGAPAAIEYAVVTLHGPVLIDAYIIQSPVEPFDKGSAAHGDILAEDHRLRPRIVCFIAPPMGHCSIGEWGHDFEVAGSAEISLDEPYYTVYIGRAKDRAVEPLARGLVEIAMVQPPGSGGIDHLEVPVIGSTGNGRHGADIVALGLRYGPFEGGAVSPVMTDGVARGGCPYFEIAV